MSFPAPSGARAAQNSRETPHRVTHYTHTRHGLTWHCRCGATGTSPWDDQARRDGRDHVWIGHDDVLEVRR